MLVYSWWKCKLVQPLWKRVWSFLKKLKMELPYGPAIQLLGIYLKKPETLIQKNIWTPTFIAVCFTIVKIWKQPECPSADSWIKKLWHITQWNTTWLYKRRKSCPLRQQGWTWRNYYAKGNQPVRERQVPCDLTRMWNLTNWQTKQNQSHGCMEQTDSCQRGGAEGLGERRWRV